MDKDILRVCTQHEPHTGDLRLEVLRNTWNVYPPPSFASRQALEQRRSELQYNLRMSAGLYPWPERTPLNPKYELVGEYEGYTIQKVMFESYPGLWSTGNLYLPRPLNGPAPAILNFIGHWDNQRLTRTPDTESTAADYPQQLANFARMGFICLVTDMIGKVDSRQLSHDYGKNEKELWLSNGLGVQLWNNIRAIDLLCSMPEVDAEHIGVTGASGGASQSLFVSLVDARIKAIAPINMISLHMQGGCQCENAPGLRRHTTNAEMCAALAPRPLFLSGSTGDWTCNLMTGELPVMQRAYAHYGAADKVETIFQHADHQYNSITRHKVYSFFARHLMGKELEWEEQPIALSDVQDLTWFRGNGRAPGFADDSEFFAFHKQERTRQTAALPAGEQLDMLRWMTGVTDRLPQTVRRTEQEFPGETLEKGILADGLGTQIPYALRAPADWNGNRLVILLSAEGKACLAASQADTLVAQGCAVLSADLYLSGEFAGDPQPRNRDINYKTIFHDSDDARRVQDIALLGQLAESRITAGGSISLCADAQTSCPAACALPFLQAADAQLDRSVQALATDEDYMNRCYIPGICILGGPEGCIRLSGIPVTYQ